MFFKVGVFKIVGNIHRKTPVLESLFDKVADLKTVPIKKLDRVNVSESLVLLYTTDPELICISQL